MNGYEISWFIGRDSSGYFLGKNMKGGYYIALRPQDLNPFTKKQTRTTFWREFWK